MEFVNACNNKTPTKEQTSVFLRILAPYAPHIAEELWEKMGHTAGLTFTDWPEWSEAAMQDSTQTIAIQVMGKMRAAIEFPLDATKEEILEAAKSHPKIAPRLEGKNIIREIYVPNRLVNIVAK